MELIDKIENCNIGIYVDDEKIIYQQDGCIFQYIPENKSKQLLFQTEFKTHTIDHINDSIYLVGSKGFQKIENKTTKFTERDIGDYEIKENQFLFPVLDYDYEKYLPKMGCIDIFTNQVLWSGEYGEQLRSNRGNAFSISKTKMAKRNHVTGEIEWDYNFEETTYCPNLIIGQLYTLLGISEKDLLICFDNKDGNKLWEQTSMSKGILIDDKQDSFHQFMVNYVQFSLSDATKLKHKNDSSYYRSINIENQKDNYVQLGNHLLINDSRSKKTGKFNLETLEFDWINEGLSIPQGYRIRKNQSFVFLINQDKTLNIFRWKTG